jgi:hypothetical protein
MLKGNLPVCGVFLGEKSNGQSIFEASALSNPEKGRRFRYGEHQAKIS